MTRNALRLDQPPTNAQITARYMREFREQQEQVRGMEVRAVQITDCNLLAVFEIYAAVNLRTPYNDFCTH